MPLPEWLIERGIGESRYALVDDGEILEARIALDGLLRAGDVITARLKQTAKPALAVAGMTEFLLPRGAPGVTEGAGTTIASRSTYNTSLTSTNSPGVIRNCLDV